MKKFPREFADLLTLTGKRVLDGNPAAGTLAPRERFFTSIGGAVDPAKARAAYALLEVHLAPHLRRMERGIPPAHQHYYRKS